MTEQLSGMDAAFLALESAEMPLHVVGVLLLDPAAGAGFSVDRLRELVRERLHLMPPFCRRLVDVPLALDRPYWHYEQPADLDDHVVETPLAAPGDLAALGALVGEIATERLDRRRPLWQLHIVPGLSDGRVALVAKVHHSTLYGAAGADFIAELLDLAPEPAPARRGGDPVERPSPGRWTVLRRTAVSTVRRPLDVGRLVVAGTRNAGGTVAALAGALRRHGRSALPAVAPSVAISGPLTPARSAAFVAMPLDDARKVKDAAGVKLNDVVLAVVALALRRYLADRDALTERVTAGVPVNAGEGDTTGTNTLSTMLVSLPLAPLTPLELLTAVHDATVAAKEFTAAVGLGAIAELADVTPPAVLSTVTWLQRTLGLSMMQPRLANLVVSNVMGPPIPLYLAGAQVDAIYPLGPLLPGAGMNVTVLSNLDRLDVGLMACPDLVDDVWAVANAVPAALADLVAALA